MSVTIYTLELENNKIYVGRSKLPKQRIIKHFSDSDCEWTKKHKPTRILSQIKGDEFDEEKYTLLAMEKYGIENVRGGSYCKVKLSKNDMDKALQTIRSLTDKCYSCGEKGHFSKNCKINKNMKSSDNAEESSDNEEECCIACGGSGICYWSDGIYGNCLMCCCIDCGKNCKCTTCDKCEGRITTTNKHECKLCIRCNTFSEYDCECDKCVTCDVYAELITTDKRCFKCLKV